MRVRYVYSCWMMDRIAHLADICKAWFVLGNCDRESTMVQRELSRNVW
jgi:hypothetical protein